MVTLVSSLIFGSALNSFRPLRINTKGSCNASAVPTHLTLEFQVKSRRNKIGESPHKIEVILVNLWI